MPMHTAEIRKKKYRFSFRESGSDRNFGYFQSLPTVYRTLSYTIIIIIIIIMEFI